MVIFGHIGATIRFLALEFAQRGFSTTTFYLKGFRGEYLCSLLMSFRTWCVEMCVEMRRLCTFWTDTSTVKNLAMYTGEYESDP